MTTYTRRWSQACGVAVAAGVGISLLVWNPVLVLGLWMVGVYLTAIGLALHAQTDARAPLRMPPGQFGRMWVHAACAAAAVVAGCGYLAASATVAVTLIVAGAATSPWIRGLAHRFVEAGEPTEADQSRTEEADERAMLRLLATTADPESVQLLSNDELCRGWRETFLPLLQQNDPAVTALVVALRQVYLDEIERRDPSGLQAWLMSGARAAGSPEKFLTAGLEQAPPDVS